MSVLQAVPLCPHWEKSRTVPFTVLRVLSPLLFSSGHLATSLDVLGPLPRKAEEVDLFRNLTGPIFPSSRLPVFPRERGFFGSDKCFLFIGQERFAFPPSSLIERRPISPEGRAFSKGPFLSAQAFTRSTCPLMSGRFRLEPPRSGPRSIASRCKPLPLFPSSRSWEARFSRAISLAGIPASAPPSAFRAFPMTAR